MTAAKSAATAKKNSNADVEPEYFYTQHTPYKYSSGPRVSTWNPDTMTPIKSIVEAKELAERFRIRSTGDDAVTTTYGVQYKVQ